MKKILFVILMAAVSFPAFAQIECTGTVLRNYITASGDLTIKGSWKTSDYTTLFNLDSTRDSVSPAVCKAWLGQILAAQSSGKQVMTTYDNVNSCQDIPVYSNSPAPNYIMLID